MPTQLTTQQFVIRAQEAHGQKWKYDDTAYVNKTIKITFWCDTHGHVKQLPANHIKIGCPFCSGDRHTTYSFVAECKKKYPYDYSATVYQSTKKKVIFKCPDHGNIEQLPNDHLSIGCPRCAGKMEMTYKHTPQTVLRQARKVHGDKYIYPDLTFETIHDKIPIVCAIHGQFVQHIYAHINEGHGCPKCGLENRRLPNQKTTSQFLEEATNKWSDKYDYKDTEYVNKSTKVRYNCSKHGDVEQMPCLHLKSGCPFCNGRGISRHSKQSFIAVANKTHNSKYNYDKANFLRMTDEIVITCPKHGDFTQRAGSHIHLRNGCPKCAKSIRSSAGEKEVANFIRSLYDGPIVLNDREVLKGQEIDIYLPKMKMGIEYNGLYWHVETVRGKMYHYNKWKAAHKQGVRLLQIYDIDWTTKRTIIESMLRHRMGHSTTIAARKTSIVELDRHTKEEFLTKNHLQGSDSSKIAYGLEYENKLVACMTFGPSRFSRDFNYELLRYCNKCDYSVTGGASRLLKVFSRSHSGSLVSYADKRYSDGSLYRRLGFILDSETRPTFEYVNLKNGSLHNRMVFQKASLKNMPGYSDDLREHEIMQMNGYDRIWNAGLYRFSLNL